MAASFATVAEFLERISTRYAEDLTTADPNDPNAPPAEARIQHALDDASAELRTWFPRIPTAVIPDADGKRVHCIKVATYMLTLDRPGKEYEQIRNAYNDTIAFYQTAATAAEAGGGSSPLTGVACRPPKVFTRRNMKGF